MVSSPIPHQGVLTRLPVVSRQRPGNVLSTRTLILCFAMLCQERQPVNGTMRGKNPREQYRVGWCIGIPPLRAIDL